MNSASVITINVPVVFMARYVMVLRRATSLRGALDFFGPKCHSLRLCHFRAQKSLDFQGPPIPMPRVMMLQPSKPLSISAIKTTDTLVVLCTRVLLCGVVVCKRGGEVSLQLCRVSCEEVLRRWGVVGRPTPPPPTILKVSMDGCSWGGGAIVT
jgi:hypothetical protein